MKRCFLLFVITSFIAFAFKSSEKNTDWANYLGGSDRNHYSPLTQINPENVKNLTIAWQYAVPDSGQMQCSPIMVDGLVYGVTPTVQVYALDAATGKEVWRFGDKLNSWASTSRGVAYWTDGKDKRILHTIGSFLYAVDAKTGKSIETFGDAGKVDLHTGLPENSKDKFIISNTPGTIYKDLIIMPVRLSEDTDAALGDVRAFNVRTGKLAWSFHTIPHPKEFGYDTFPKDAYKNTEIGGANNWAGMAVDEKRGIIYVPTGSAAYDFYGANRKGQNLFANTLLALNAQTGKRLWHFQMVHHDIWDRDLPAPPNLIQVKQNGKTIDAVAQVTKTGFVYVFDRVTGKPLFDIEEVKVPVSNLAGEVAWETQPIPKKPAPFARQAYELTENDISPYAENREELIKRFQSYKKDFFAPPSKEGTIILPGFDGGAEWGGAAADTENGILYVNANEMPWILTMVENQQNKESKTGLITGEKLYTQNCVSCHGADRKGNSQSGFPSLIDIQKKRDRTYISNIIKNGKGMMTGFNALSKEENQALVAFLLGDEKKEVAATNSKVTLAYKSTGYHKFLDSKGLPAIAPPWGTMSAIDLNTGEYLWKIPFGQEPTLKQNGTNTGTENYGGPVVTASGLLFIAATKDGMFRAFDKKTGQLLWQIELPAPAFSTPATYQFNGKQYIVLTCGGTKLGTKKGNQVVAFALP